MSTPTPETDAKAERLLAIFGPNNRAGFALMCDFARKLELDRDAWKAKAERTCVWSNREWSEFCKTECGERFQIPCQVKYKCCPSCGGRIIKEEK